MTETPASAGVETESFHRMGSDTRPCDEVLLSVFVAES